MENKFVGESTAATGDDDEAEVAARGLVTLVEVGEAGPRVVCDGDVFEDWFCFIDDGSSLDEGDGVAEACGAEHFIFFLKRGFIVFKK